MPSSADKTAPPSDDDRTGFEIDESEPDPDGFDQAHLDHADKASRAVAADDIVIDPGTIPAAQDTGKPTTVYTMEAGEEEIVFRIKYPKLPEGSKAKPEAVRSLFEWWVLASVKLSAGMVVKAAQYATIDLYVLGRTMAETMNMDPSQMTRGQMEELGIFFYVQGKLARWQGAITEGRAVSDDTIADGIVYLTMIQRIREAGSWPGIALNQ